jgi:hypothetical protein
MNATDRIVCLFFYHCQRQRLYTGKSNADTTKDVQVHSPNVSGNVTAQSITSHQQEHDR